MNSLEQYFLANRGPLMNKWMHYFDIYDRHLARFRNQSPVMLEIGVYHGGSLGMWKDYFGPGARIIGVDINPRAKRFADEQVTIEIGDQSDREFLRQLRARHSRIDILLDDGGHTVEQQRITFEEMFSAVAHDGVYLIEDVHTSYWPEYGGGLGEGASFVEFCKRLVDDLNAWHVREWDQEQRSEVAQAAHSISFYDSVIAIEKRVKAPPFARMTGKLSFLSLDE
ncbi:8-demethyl-8-(2-methoxy-alpha-L-rhamnosyl)-tetracenomycin-C 3'-O-methyltransferase [Burkholderiales bacterium]|nr:8-demethyl-8-(2-methoxy-alpha-L-rhamnosyl)-tetracenomycin-C 3'-O-methyltransferase [Burkholderiales bacterium]